MLPMRSSMVYWLDCQYLEDRSSNALQGLLQRQSGGREYKAQTLSSIEEGQDDSNNNNNHHNIVNIL